MKNEYKFTEKLPDELKANCEELLGEFHKISDMEVMTELLSIVQAGHQTVIDALAAYLSTKENLESWEYELLGMCKMITMVNAASQVMMEMMMGSKNKEEEENINGRDA